MGQYKYSATQDDIINFCDKHIGDYRIRNGELVAKTCPFCSGGENNDEYTFAVGLHNGAWNCMRGGCSKSGSFRDLCEFFGERAENTVMLTTRKTKKLYVRPNPDDLKPVTEEILNYFALRSISKETVETFKIASDNSGNIVFPFYRNNELVYVKFREPRKFVKGEGKRKEWQTSNTEPILFGMDNVSFRKPLYICEGQIDAMSLYEAGITNVVSVPCGCNNLEFVSLCWDWLEKFHQIVLFGDNDEPGLAMVSTLSKRLGEDRCLLPPEYPELIVEDKRIGRPCKDANEILYSYGKAGLKEVAESCQPAPIEGILNLADVAFVDPANKPRIFTRIPQLDQDIGGLGEGSLTIFSGKRGEGKSTIGGQLMLNAIEQGHSVCAYSGELRADNFLNWIMLQATESAHVEARSDPRTGKNFATVPYDVQQRIKTWINDKFFLFDNNYVSEKELGETVIKTFTLCAKRYGCKLFLVDNLMSLMSETTAENENKAQTKFVAALKAFAVKYKVAVLLVCHPRKAPAGQKFENDSVAGSGNITNLADIVINIEKPNIRITKNREFGICDFIHCGYNPVNRRIFQANIGDRTVYSWNHEGLKEPEMLASSLPEFAIQQGTPEHGSSLPF